MNDIRFTVSEPAKYQAEARDKAFDDAKGRAEQLAKRSGVALGSPLHISENSGGVYGPAPRGIAEAAGGDISTPLDPGQTEIVVIREILPPRDIQEAMSRQMSAERYRRATVTDSEGTREAAIKIADGNRESAILNAEGQKRSAVLNAEGNREAAILNAEGFAMALDRILLVARNLDENTMALQYLDMMRTLASGPSTKWVVPVELTSFAQRFASNLSAAAPPAPSEQDDTSP